jgi:bifunctional DNA-binding transcriptional regulator/antitoxin component of YhaV-PrlF toxin-antitoxin module
MISQTATITSKGQITIPIKIIKQAKLKKGQKLIFTFENNIIHMESVTDMINRLAGSLPTPKKFIGMNIDKIIQIAKEEHFSKKIQ